tara:strand:- start:217874 stop:218581 length:708 start_codon:yes stop_codon:yes gene_type:complete
MLRQIALDTETTGLSPQQGHRIIEIGCVELINRRVTGKTYHVYINPERDVEAGAMQVHGITDEFLKDKPLFADIADEFLAFIKESELIIHNAPFDTGFIDHEFAKLRSKKLSRVSEYCKITDTLKMGREMHPGQRNSLDALCKRYDIDNSKRDLHGALIDADLLASLFLQMTSGQDSLFAETDATQTSNQQATSNQTTNKEISYDKLVVVSADTDETTAHNAYLEKMETCVWTQE